MSNLELKDPAYSHGNFDKSVEFSRGVQKQSYINRSGRVAVQ